MDGHIKRPGNVEGSIAPVFNNALFRDNSDSDFAVVGLGYGMFPEGVDKDLFSSYLRLRKNVYVDQTGMLPRNTDYPNGMEYDEDDERSSHVAVFRNLGNELVAAVSCMRAIHKNKGNKPLCIEESLGISVPDTSSEASRYIVVEGKARERLSIRDRLLVSQKLFDAMVAIFYHEQLSPVYGLIEKPVERALSRAGAPPIRIDTSNTDGIVVDKFGGTEHVGVAIDIPAMAQSMKLRLGENALQSSLLTPGQANFWTSNAQDRALAS